MPQLNIHLDEQLHKNLLKISDKRGSSLTDLTRNFLRSLSPEMENFKVQLIEKIDNNGIYEHISHEILLKGQITEIVVENERFFCGVLFATANDVKELFSLSNVKNGVPQHPCQYFFSLKNEEGKQGWFSIVSVSSSFYDPKTGGLGSKYAISSLTTLS